MDASGRQLRTGCGQVALQVAFWLHRALFEGPIACKGASGRLNRPTEMARVRVCVF